MSIVKGYSRKSNTTYFYDQDMHWNPETGRPEGTRRLIGKLDVETGKMVPTGKRGRPKKKTEQDQPSVVDTDQRILELQGKIDDLTKMYQELFDENARLKTLNRDYEKKIQVIKKSFDSLYDKLADL